MFASRYIAVLLALVMAACPLVCLGNCYTCDCEPQGGHHASDRCHGERGHTGCEGTEGTSTERPAPASHDHDHDHGDCVCEGAVSGVSQNELYKTFSFLSHYLPMELPEVRLASFEGSHAACGLMGFVTGGASLCILTGRWLN